MNGRMRLITAQIPLSVKGKQLGDALMKAMNQSETAGDYEKKGITNDNSSKKK